MLASPPMRASAQVRDAIDRSALRRTAVPGVPAALVTAAAFFGGGSGDERLVPIGGAAVVAAAAAVAAAALGRLAAPRLDAAAAAAAALLAGLAAWSGLSVWWSAQPDRSWAYLNRGIVYVAFLVLGLFLGAAVRSPPRFAAVGAALLSLVLLWALAGEVVPALGPEEDRVARLRSPIGYWNGVALFAVFALAVGLWVSASRAHARWARALGAVMLFLALVVLALTTSRGGIVVAVLVVGTWLALARDRLDGAVAVGAAGIAALAVATWALNESALTEPAQPSGDRVAAGALLGLFVVAGSALVGGAAWWLAGRRPTPRAESLARRAAVGLAALALVAGAAAVATRGGDWWDEFANPADVQVPTGSERLGNVSSNNRWRWWNEAWQGFEEAPLAGTGAGSFAYTHLRLRKSDQFVVAPHNVALQFLSETGLIGFLLFTGAAAAAAVAVARTVGAFDGAAREAAVALSLVPLAFLLHSLVDYHWDFVALAAPALAVLGYLLVAARDPDVTPPRRPLLAASAVLLAAGALVSLAAPWLAERRVAAAYDAVSTDPARAAAEASDAHDLNSLSVEPLFAWAAAEEARGHLREALGRYEQATRLQPKNAETWRTLATFELEVMRNPDRALAHFDCMYALDPLGPALDLLDEARERARDPSTSCPR